MKSWVIKIEWAPSQLEEIRMWDAEEYAPQLLDFRETLLVSFLQNDLPWLAALREIWLEGKKVDPSSFFIVVGRKIGANQDESYPFGILVEYTGTLSVRAIGPRKTLHKAESDINFVMKHALDLLESPSSWEKVVVISHTPQSEWKKVIEILSKSAVVEELLQKAQDLLTVDPREALTYALRAQKIYNQTENANGEFISLLVVAEAARLMGNYPIAQQYLQHSLEIADKLGDTAKLQVLNNLAGLYVDEGAYNDAIKLYEEVLEIATKANLASEQINVKINLAECYRRAGGLNKALNLFEEVLVMAKAANEMVAQAYALNGMAKTLEEIDLLNNFDQVKEYYEEALKRFEKLKMPEEQIHVLENLTSIFERRQDISEALYYVNKAFNIAKENKLEEKLRYLEEKKKNLIEPEE